MIQYILDVSLTWVFLYLIFYVFLRKETFFNVNRYYLISAISTGILLPFLRHLHFDLQATDLPEVAPLVMFIQESPSAITQSIEEVRQVWYMDLYNVLALVYVLGALFFLVRLLKGLWNIYSIYQSSRKEYKNGHVLVHSNADHLPFSFLNAIYISTNVPLKEEYNEVITHELEHVNSHHSLDVLYFEIVNVLFWFNPLIYLYKSAIKQTHEYLADAAVLHQTDKKMYGHILLRQSLSGIQIALAHSFFQSHIKKRITMMYQKKSGRWAGLKYLLVLPLLSLIAAAFSLKEEGMKGFTSTEFAEEIQFLCNGEYGNIFPVHFFTEENSALNSNVSGGSFFLTENLKKLVQLYNPKNNVLFIVDGKQLKQDDKSLLNFSTDFKAQELGIYSPDYAVKKFGDIGKYGAVEFKGMNKMLDDITRQKIIDNLEISEIDNDTFREFRQDRYETLRMGDDTWEAEIYSDYVGYLELRILNSKFEVVHKVDVLKKEKRLIIPLDYHSHDKSHQIRIVELDNSFQTQKGTNDTHHLIDGQRIHQASIPPLNTDKSLYQKIKSKAVDYLGLGSLFKMTCHLPGLDYTVRHGDNDQLAFSFESKMDRDIEVYFDYGKDIITKNTNIQKGHNKISFPSTELPSDPFIIKIGTKGIDCNCTFGILDFNKKRGKFETIDQTFQDWNKKWGDEKTFPNKVSKIHANDSIPSQKPLLVINGKRFRYMDKIADVDPGDIDHINVYKDEEALEKYGEEGKFGVVEIFTKKSNIFIHGNKTETENIDPLYVVDGEIQPAKRDAAKDIDPDNIKEINVLKGEKALKKYGELGVNGVVEIFTKGSNISIRGNQKEVENIDPLFVVDGDVQPAKRDATKDIDPDNIKEINVLKGEKALKKYGELGVNGVVEVTLKKPNKWKSKNEVFINNQIESDTFIVFDAETFEERTYIHDYDHLKSVPEGSKLISDIKLFNQNGPFVAIGFKTESEVPAQIILSSIDGRVLDQKTMSITRKGDIINFVEFENIQLSNGIYIISIQQGQEVASQKISLFR